eukprot:scaffold118715_cov31-Tisochrysis_lutea.AAC.4
MKRAALGVDVLSLSATPIPRTMYMCMSGIREMSTLHTPPEGRRPIVTSVRQRSDDVVREAIEAEVARGGQVRHAHPYPAPQALGRASACRGVASNAAVYAHSATSVPTHHLRLAPGLLRRAARGARRTGAALLERTRSTGAAFVRLWRLEGSRAKDR